ncbi:MAG TPA: IPT/TIG domain-containing protein [Candidatus Acidoferrales bacterium]|nr:IPT/TIG domain-containing protein [Candidatus Acidoferrales bacterium]
MRQRFALLGTLLAVCLILSGGCASKSNSSTTPVISSISPSTIPAGEGQFILSVSGTNMNGSSVVHFGTDNLTPLQVLNPPCPTGMNCVTTLEVSVPPVDVVNAGSVQVSVTTASQNSTNVNFTVASPQILTISPMAAAAGGAGFPLTVTVLNAAPNVQINFGATTPLVPTGPVSCNPATACAVQVVVPKAAIATAGTVTLTIANPKAAKGGTATTSLLVTGTGQFPIDESASGGTPGNAASLHSSVSDGGIFVAFDSKATNLVSGATNGLSQVYLAQNCLASGGNCTAKVTLISSGSGGPGAGGVIGSDRPAISADGRFVVFESDDTNLVSGATQAVEQIYLYDTCSTIFGAVSNCTPKTTLVSQGAGSAEGNAPSTNPSISGFGLYIAFQSSATNLTSTTVPAGTQQIYLFASCNAVGGAVSGCKPDLQLFSTDANNNPGDNNSVRPSVDPAGLTVAFQSVADNIVAGIASNGAQQIYLRNTCLSSEPFLQTGCQQQTVLVSADAGNKPGAADSVTPAVSNGSFVVYATRAANLLPANATGQQILGTNICIGIPSTVSCTPSGNLMLSVDQTGLPGQGDSSNPAIAGTRAVFTSLATLVPGAAGQQVYAANACIPPLAPCSASTTLISVDAQSNPLGGDFGSAGGGGYAAFSTATSATPQVFLAAPH